MKEQTYDVILLRLVMQVPMARFSAGHFGGAKNAVKIGYSRVQV